MILFPLAYTLAIYPTLAALGMVELGSRNLRLDYFVLGFFGSCLYALGEELGWRGLLAPAATRRFGFHRGQLLIGLVWFVYHLPALLFTGYGKSPYPVYGNAMFLVSVVGLSVLLGWVRHASQSVWPCVAYHGMHNLVFLHLFDPMERTSAAADRLIGEQGALLALVLAAAWAYAARAAARASLPAALPVTRRRDHTTPERRAT
jgi:membrane protease YdiL (CAAX protease family)